ncbi:MAG: extracellular solute-binding protein [Chloroflexota bacterium]
MDQQKRISRRRFLSGAVYGGGVTLLAACGATPEATDPTTNTSIETETSAPGTAGGLTLTYWVPMEPNVAASLQNYSDMTCYKELAKRTDISLDFQHPSTNQSGQLQEQFNLMIASGSYPDVIEAFWLNDYNGGPIKAIEDNIILRLNDLIEQHAPNLTKVLNDNPEWRKQVVTDNGDIYCFPFLRGDRTLLTFAGPTIRQDWLDTLGVEKPRTIDEWDIVLTAFKDQDPNGNGTADEFPFTSWLFGSPRAGFDRTHAFVGAWGITTGFYQVDGAIQYGPTKPEFREFLTIMTDWYNRKLLDPDTFSMDQNLMDAKVTGGTLGAAVMALGGGIGKYTSLMEESDAAFNLQALPYPVLNAGDSPILGQRDSYFTGLYCAAITTSNQNPEETVRLLDYAYGEEGHLLFNFGVEGETYTMENGKPIYTDEIMNNPDDLPIAQALGKHVRSSFGGPFVQAKGYGEQYFQLPQQQDGLEVWSTPSNERQLPPLTPTAEEARRIGRIEGEINTRFDEIFSKILTGAEPLETWDTFQQELQQLGIEEAIAIQQAALDRYNQRA